MPKNILVFSGNILYTLNSLYECMDNNNENDKSWGTSNNVYKTQEGKCEIESRCEYSYKNASNDVEQITDFFSKFSKTFDPDTQIKFYKDVDNFSGIIDTLLKKGFELWSKSIQDNTCEQTKLCLGSWRDKMKLFWFTTLSILTFIKHVLDEYNHNNYPDIYLSTMAWANYVMSAEKYVEVFPKNTNAVPYDIGLVMKNLINNNDPYKGAEYYNSSIWNKIGSNVFRLTKIYENTSQYNNPPLFVVDCGSSGTRIQLNNTHPIFNYKFNITLNKIKLIVSESSKLKAFQYLEWDKDTDDLEKFILTMKQICDLVDTYYKNKNKNKKKNKNNYNFKK